MDSKFPVYMHIYTICPYYKVSGNSVERFQMSCAKKKNRTDGLTDGRVKNIIPSATLGIIFVGYN